jgi:hypothetical protein
VVATHAGVRPGANTISHVDHDVADAGASIDEVPDAHEERFGVMRTCVGSRDVLEVEEFLEASVDVANHIDSLRHTLSRRGFPWR